MLFDETYFEESNINKIAGPNIITKFGQKNERVGFWEKRNKTTLKLKKMLFYETYFKESNMNKKPLIWSHVKIIQRFVQKILF